MDLRGTHSVHSGRWGDRGKTEEMEFKGPKELRNVNGTSRREGSGSKSHSLLIVKQPEGTFKASLHPFPEVAGKENRYPEQSSFSPKWWQVSICQVRLRKSSQEG